LIGSNWPSLTKPFPLYFRQNDFKTLMIGSKTPWLFGSGPFGTNHYFTDPLLVKPCGHLLLFRKDTTVVGWNPSIPFFKGPLRPGPGVCFSPPRFALAVRRLSRRPRFFWSRCFFLFCGFEGFGSSADWPPFYRVGRPLPPFAAGRPSKEGGPFSRDVGTWFFPNNGRAELSPFLSATAGSFLHLSTQISYFYAFLSNFWSSPLVRQRVHSSGLRLRFRLTKETREIVQMCPPGIVNPFSLWSRPVTLLLLRVTVPVIMAPLEVLHALLIKLF